MEVGNVGGILSSEQEGKLQPHTPSVSQQVYRCHKRLNGDTDAQANILELVE